MKIIFLNKKSLLIHSCVATLIWTIAAGLYIARSILFRCRCSLSVVVVRLLLAQRPRVRILSTVWHVSILLTRIIHIMNQCKWQLIDRPPLRVGLLIKYNYCVKRQLGGIASYIVDRFNMTISVYHMYLCFFFCNLRRPNSIIGRGMSPYASPRVHAVENNKD